MLAVLTVTAIAQETPRDLRDLVGQRASSGESQLRNRGFVWIKTTEGSDRKWSNWWNNGRRLCISVQTYDGRYASIVTAPRFDCERGGGGNVDRQTNPPDWMVGTWYGRGPRGESITLDFDRRGYVSAEVNGGFTRGFYASGDILVMGGARARISRQGQNLVTTRIDNGERISYSRSTWGGANNGPGWGPQVNPPFWATGTFYGNGPRGERITLSISSSGEVRADINGNVTRGSWTSGNYINMAGAVASVTRSGRNLVTTRVDNGERIVYSPNRQYDNRVEVSDLVGARASGGEDELRRRGFRNVDGFKEYSTAYAIWWRSASRQCIQVGVVNGRFDSVRDIGSHSRCR
jgi:hypothetical protein